MDASSNPPDRDPWDRLNCYRRNITSQCGEDGIIEHLLALLPETPKTCLEVGAGDGITLSNTNTLWSQKGWRALLIEGAPGSLQLLQKRIADHSNVTAVAAMIAPRGPNAIDEIVKRANFPTRLGVLSLDIDSNDLEIFENLRDIVADIVVIEFNHEIPADVAYRDLPGDVFFRHSAKAVEASANARGYRVVACTGPNAILLREDLIKGDVANKVPNLPIEALFDFAFLRGRRSRYRLVESKFITEQIAVCGVPSGSTKALVSCLVFVRQLRRRLRGKPAGAAVTPERREHLHRAGLWI